MEIWKKIEGYENYQVSNLGRIKSLDYNRTGKEQIMKPTKQRGGYLLVSLLKNGKRKGFLLHRLVAMAFIPNPENLPEVNHIDEDKTNNRVDNLNWCTRKENCNYGTRNERMAKALKGRKQTQEHILKNSIPIVQLTKNGEYIATHQSARQVQRELGYNECNINKCCRGKRNKAYNFKWSYLKDRKFLSELPFLSRKDNILQRSKKIVISNFYSVKKREKPIQREKIGT